MKLTEKQIVILEALARFKYLTSQQLQLIFRNKSTSAINAAIRWLKGFKYPLVKSLSFGVLPGHGKLPHVHYLSQSGAKILAEQLWMSAARIQLPKNRNNFFQRDYFHRISVVTFNILLQRWLADSGHLFYFFKLYFNRVDGLPYQSETRVKLEEFSSEPDWIGLYFANTQPQLFAFEQHNGHDTKRALKQITNHCYGLANGAISEKFKIQKPVKIFYVFENESCMAAVIRRFCQDEGLMRFKKQFFFKTNQQLLEDFANDWVSPEGAESPFLAGQ